MRSRLPLNIADISTQLRSPAVFVIITGTLMVFLLGGLATYFHKPLVVPPIGPTIFILFAFPLAQEAQPRNVICGYAIGIAAGAASLAAFGLLNVTPDLNDLGLDRLLAVTLSMALVLTLLTALRVLHIPAVATALLISLGLLHEPEDWATIMAAVLVCVVVALVLARAMGVPMPLWSRGDAPHAAELEERDFGDR